MNPKLIKYSFLFLVIVAIIGTTIRFSFIYSIPVSYTNILHAHSHVAFQGWVYLSLFFLLTSSFLNTQTLQSGKYKLQFFISFFVIIGILVSFIYQSYGLYSITFSSIFQLLSYWLTYRFLTDLKRQYSSQKQLVSIRFVRAAFWFNLISTFATWSVGIISAKGFSGGEIYNAAIYCFLHFQYNGWFTLALLGLFYRYLEDKQIQLNYKYANYFFYFLCFSVVPAYTLSLLGMSFRNEIIYVAYLSAILQLVSIFYFVKSVLPLSNQLFKNEPRTLSWVILISVMAFILKLFIQSISVFDLFTEMVSTHRYIIMAFLHLVFIGFVTFGILGFLIKRNLININNKTNQVGVILIIIGFIISEIGLVANQYSSTIILQKIIAYSSLLMTIGFLVLFSTILLSTKQ